ncbi:SCF ubiquitin ligase complex subunit, partial [Modicella reniformis]
MNMDIDMSILSLPSQNSRPVASLPSELILHIFKFLMTPHDIRNAILVCKLWCSCGMDLLWSKPPLMTVSAAERMARTIASPNQTFPYADYIRRLNLSFLGTELTDSVLLPFGSCSRLERLLLAGSVNITADALGQILLNCSGLSSLDLSEIPAVSDTLLEDVVAKCPRLHTVYLGSCSAVTDQAVVKLATSCTQLKRVKLSQCGLLTDRSIKALTEHCSQLMEIDVTSCSLVSDAAIHTVFEKLSQIRDINMTLLTNLTDLAFGSIYPTTHRYEQLRVLNLTSCPLITDETLFLLIPAAPRLRSLALTKCDKITDLGASVIKILGKHLHYLHLGHCVKITDWLVATLAQHCTRIRYLDLACCTKLTDASVFALAQLPKLRRVGLVKCTNITDHGIYAMLVSQILPQSLERMHLSYCVNLSESAVAALVTQCPKLTHLSVTGVPSFVVPKYQNFCRPPPSEFTPHQRDVFCVFSGKGVRDLRNYMQDNLNHYTCNTTIANIQENYRRISSSVATLISGSEPPNALSITLANAGVESIATDVQDGQQQEANEDMMNGVATEPTSQSPLVFREEPTTTTAMVEPSSNHQGSSPSDEFPVLQHPHHRRHQFESSDLPQSQEPRVAHLGSVSWLDVSAVFSRENVLASSSSSNRYKVQWNINLTGACPDAVVVGTAFRAVVFGKNEACTDPASEDVSKNRQPAISFTAQSLEELMRHTNRPSTVPCAPKNLQELMMLRDKYPGYEESGLNGQRGFFQLTLPGEVQVQDQEDLGGVLVQIQNHG